jgi:tricorn protease-like protein
LSFYNIIYRQNKYYINSYNGELYIGSNFNNLKKMNLNNIFIFDVSNDGNFLVFTINNEIYIYNLKTDTKHIIEFNISVR